MSPLYNNQSKEIQINKYISEKSDEIIAFINENKKVLLNASPGSGKTTFFANLCITHLQNKKEGRIIFCSPYLIIQGQFKRALEKKNVNVDLELNAASNRKQLLPQDKIITTTYKSLRLIEEDLHSNDLLIIDEAHSLLYSYKKEGKRDFFVKAIQVLYKTSAKMVLMTGTPYHGISKLLSLSELRVVREEIKARVKVDYSNTKYLAVALSFAENCLMQYGKEKLNVIYIRNTKKCDSIKSAIEDNFKCKAFVLTSKRKQTAVYKTLEKESFIQKDYQFLITTNVISTGANILNNNIGKALMIDEFNPTEIKQFSKRFRKKPDIEIEIVNKNYLKNERPVEEVRQELIEERNHQRFFYQRLLDAIKVFYTGEENLFKFDRNFHNETFIGSPVQLLENTIERLVIQEAYFVEQISYTFNTPKELVKALNKHDDVTSVLTESIDDNPQIDDGIYKQLDDLKFQSIISDFIVRQDIYFQTLLHYFTSIKDAYEKWKLEDFLKARRNIQNIRKKDLDKDILEIITQFDFISRILYPLYTVDEFIQDIPKSLYFIKTTPTNKRKSTLISLHINDLFRRYLNLDYQQYPLHPPSLKRKKNINSLTLREDAVTSSTLNLLIKTYSYLTSYDYINYEVLNKYLLDAELKFPLKSSFILDEIEIELPSKEVINYKKNLLIGLVNGLFYINPNQKYRKDPKGNRKATYMFELNLPNINEAKTTLQKKERKVIHDQQEKLDFQLATRRFSYPKLNPSPRFITSKNLILHKLLDDEYYYLIEDIEN